MDLEIQIVILKMKTDSARISCYCSSEIFLQKQQEWGSIAYRKVFIERKGCAFWTTFLHAVSINP